MTDLISMDEAQLQKLLSAIQNLKENTSFFQHFLVAAAPVFFGAILGLAFGFATDWVRTRREKRNVSRERREKELAQISIMMTAIGFNIETLLHTVMQQILPHLEKSYAASSAIEAVGKAVSRRQFEELLHSEFRPMFRRCPEPHFIETDLFRDVPFVVAKDPELLKLSGWILMFVRNLRSVLTERNKNIDLATLGNDPMDLDTLKMRVNTQAEISGTEVVYSYQLFEQLREVAKRLETIISDEYKEVSGPKLKIALPVALESTLEELKRICKEVVPDWPEPEQPPVPSTSS